MIQKVDHIGIAVNSLDDAIEYYEQILGHKCNGIEEIAEQKVRTAFFKVGDLDLELLEPLDEDSSIAKFLGKHGEGVHHIAFQSSNIKAELQHAREQGLDLINKEPVNGAHGKFVAFLHPRSTHGVLTEFCSIKKAPWPVRFIKCRRRRVTARSRSKRENRRGVRPVADIPGGREKSIDIARFK